MAPDRTRRARRRFLKASLALAGLSLLSGCGQEKAAALARMRAGDPSIPAGRISHDHAIVLCDRAAAAKLEAA